MQESVYKFARLTPDSIGNLDTIARSAFGVGLDHEYLLKEYDTFRFGAAYTGYLAYEENSNEPAAFYGVFPMEVLVDGQTILVAQSGNTMTHKNHQGKGLFVQLARKTYELAESEQIHCIFGFPNKNSYPGFVRKLNWEHVNDLTRFTRKISTFPAAHFARKYPFFRKVYKWCLRKTLSERIFFESSIIATGSNGVKRSKAYWDYKAYSDNFTFEVDGIKVWCRIDGILHVGDIEYLQGADYDRVFRKIFRKARWMGCHKVVLQTSSNSWLASVAKLHCSQEQGLPFGLLKLGDSNYNFRDLQFNTSDFDTF